MDSECVSGGKRRRPVAASQTHSVRSRDPVTTVRPSGVHTIEGTEFVCGRVKGRSDPSATSMTSTPRPFSPCPDPHGLAVGGDGEGERVVARPVLKPRLAGRDVDAPHQGWPTGT